MRRPALLAAVLVVAGLTVAVAAPALRYDFVYDDEAMVLERKPFWELGAAAFLASRPHVTGRHLAAVSLDLDRLEAGTVPRPFHRTSIALAALLSVLVLGLAMRVGLSLFPAAAAAVLFAVHPAHVDAVVWIVCRSELLAAIGVVATMIVCIRPADDGALRHPWPAAAASALFATIAVLSKESALCLPILLVLARFFLGPRVALGAGLAGSAVATAAWLAVALPLMADIAPTQFVDNPLAHVPTLERIPKALAVLWQYAALLVWPHPLLPDRSWAMTNPGIVQGWIAAAAWAVAALVVLRLPRPSAAAFALAWMPAAFAVTSNVAAPIGVIMAERLLLLPSVGACLLAGVAVEALATTPLRRRIAAVAVLVVVAVFFTLFRARAAVWENGDVYFAASVAASPRSAKAQFDYGSWMIRRKNPVEAEAALARAVEMIPHFSRAANLLAESMARRGEPAAGAEVYRAYLVHRPDDAAAMKNLTRLLLKANRPQEAVEWAQRRTALEPGDRNALESLVIAEGAVRRAEESAKRRAAEGAERPAAEGAERRVLKPGAAPGPVNP
ncbi:MAG: hypothetical protein ABR538_01385 [Candidatus Binatia bacterium]